MNELHLKPALILGSGFHRHVVGDFGLAKAQSLYVIRTDSTRHLLASHFVSNGDSYGSAFFR